ncbi:MAG: glutathione S-transferase family protein [Nitratireductor rhodophyticola]|uniref:glutathione S-transferase family protein n=1 Tax=Nitratireductor rhodophyticola TaxID=2854036 RepID=UPI0032D95CD4
MSLPRLYSAPPSPFARKVRIAALEAGRELELVEVSTSPVAPDREVVRANPLGKIPALHLPGGEVLYDSAVICRYLGEGTPLYPQGPALWRALRREALANGLMDAAVLARYETTLRPEPLRWPEWVQGQMQKIHCALAAMVDDAPNADALDIGDVATGCALGYLDLRYSHLDWRADFPTLARFAEAVAMRPAFLSTAPG